MSAPGAAAVQAQACLRTRREDDLEISSTFIKSQVITVNHFVVPDLREQYSVWPHCCQEELTGWEKRAALRVSDDAEKASQEKAVYKLFEDISLFWKTKALAQ